MVKISRHGGHCCGVKHIYGFHCYPETVVNASVAKSDPAFSSDHCYPGKDVSGIGPCPQETFKDRLTRTIVWLEERRAEGIIEIVLASNNASQIEKWGPLLVSEFGFVRVTPELGVRNSNSGNRLHVYHRYSGVAKRLKLPETKTEEKKDVTVEVEPENVNVDCGEEVPVGRRSRVRTRRNPS